MATGLSNPCIAGRPCPSTFLTTYYAYDPLGNLISVNQLGDSSADVPRKRAFTYDSLSRLVTSTNPESGTVCYGQWSGGAAGAGTCQDGYDANGNLHYKTDANGSTVNYSYDALNRLTGKTYQIVQASVATTDPVSFVYDSLPGTGVSNAIGRLVEEYTGPLGSPTTQRTILQYDAMGHVLQEQQCVASGGCASLQYGFDLAGHVISSNNGLPGQPISWSSQYDGAGHLQTVTSSWDDSTHPATLFAPPPQTFGPQYGPAGLLAASLGVPTGSQQPTFATQRWYDNRMRVTGESDQGSMIASSGWATVTFNSGDGTRQVCFRSRCSTVPDAGTLSLTLTGPGGSLTWNVQYDGEDDPTLAGELAGALNSSDVNGNPTPVSAVSSGGVVGITALGTGSATNYPFSIAVTDQDDYPFTTSAAALQGGQDASSSPIPIYSYGLSYYANNNVQSVNDSVMGNWSYTYDALNRLQTAQASANPQTGFAPYQTAQLTWGYDSFGNYLGQTLSGSTQASASQASYSYDSSNHVVGVSYDSSGNVVSSGQSSLSYDAEGRLANVAGTSYLYDAEGRRVAKLQMQVDPNSLVQTQMQVLTNEYLLGPDGEQVTELDGQGNWLHSNVYTGGKLLATYDPLGLHFHFTDWLGTRRAQASGTGAVEETCQSLPYGDGLQCLGGGEDSTEHHFTGKERDSESGLDYFGARFYASSMGRWSSPDPSGLLLANPLNPQTLNLYAYVGNNPLRFFDPDGLSSDCGGGGDPSVVCMVTTAWDWLKGHLGGGGGTGGNGVGGSGSNPPPGWGSTPPASGHYVTVGFYPAGAGWMGHTGVGLDTLNKTFGWATQKKHAFVLYLTGLPFAGQLKQDTDTYKDRMSGLATPQYFYRAITDQQFDSMQSAMATRDDSNDSSNNVGNYDLYFRNCAQFVEDVLHAGGIGGIPHNEIFAPLGLRLLLELESHLPH